MTQAALAPALNPRRTGLRRLTLRATLAVAALTGVSSLSRPAMAQSETLTVFAAASLSNALADVGRAWQAGGGPRLRFSFAASSTLAKQIEQGAAAQLFISADTVWADYLDKRGLLVPGTRQSLLGNRLVVIVPADRAKGLHVEPGSERDWITRLPAGRIAVGDPAHVPAGIYAREALTHLGVWRSVEARLAPAESVRAALALVERGEAAWGIVYATDAAVASAVKVVGSLPESSHSPIRYPMALITGGTPSAQAVARRFQAFLLSEAARQIFRQYGFQTELAP